MVSVLLNTDELTIYGGPDTVDLLVDIGPQGQRGSKIFVGSGNPNDNPGNILETPQLNDLYIDIAASSNSYMYQYIAEPGGNTWYAILSVAPVFFSKTYAPTFASGSATIDIPLTTISSNLSTSTLATALNVQYNIEHTKPVASAIQKSIVEISSVKNLRITLKAVDFTSGTAADLSGAKTVQVFITLIPSGG